MEEVSSLNFLNFVYVSHRTRKGSITTGVVERTEAIRTDAVDRLSPLNSAVNQFISFQGINDPNNELEKFVDMDIDSQQLLRAQNISVEANATVGSSASNSTRRHTVGPGDVEHEHALVNPGAVPINFKLGTNDGPHLPINLPMLQNQPLHNFTIKNQHLLKPPTVMEASKSTFAHFSLEFTIKLFQFLAKGSFGRRASDGGTNLQIYYPASGSNTQSIDPSYEQLPAAKNLRISGEPNPIETISMSLDCGDESNDEIQRYFQVKKTK